MIKIYLNIDYLTGQNHLRAISHNLFHIKYISKNVKFSNSIYHIKGTISLINLDINDKDKTHAKLLLEIEENKKMKLNSYLILLKNTLMGNKRIQKIYKPANKMQGIYHFKIFGDDIINIESTIFRANECLQIN